MRTETITWNEDMNEQNGSRRSLDKTPTVIDGEDRESASHSIHREYKKLAAVSE